MMKVVRLRRGWRVNLTDNEHELLRELVNRALVDLDEVEVMSLPHKIRKALTARWELPHGPLFPDEDRRPAA
jgi:hypothetical protein